LLWFKTLSCQQNPADVCFAGAIAITATIAAVSGFQHGAAILYARNSVLYCWLQTLQPQCQTPGYGVYNCDATKTLEAPQQLKRHELCADKGNMFRDLQGRQVVLR